jgi:small subunit ribosomal protein S1
VLPKQDRELVTGTVQSVRKYGAFVDVITGNGVPAVGLLHISQITEERISSAEDVFKVGDKVTALVLRSELKPERFSLSTRKLEREPGEMLRDRQAVFAAAQERAAASNPRV